MRLLCGCGGSTTWFFLIEITHVLPEFVYFQWFASFIINIVRTTLVGHWNRHLGVVVCFGMFCHHLSPSAAHGLALLCKLWHTINYISGEYGGIWNLNNQKSKNLHNFVGQRVWLWVVHTDCVTESKFAFSASANVYWILINKFNLSSSENIFLYQLLTFGLENLNINFPNEYLCLSWIRMAKGYSVNNPNFSF